MVGFSYKPYTKTGSHPFSNILCRFGIGVIAHISPKPYLVQAIGVSSDLGIPLWRPSPTGDTAPTPGAIGH